jgi:hypothetical protein
VALSDDSGAQQVMTREELTHLEQIVEAGRETFVQVGQALAAIRDRRVNTERTCRDTLRSDDGDQ